MQHKFRWNRWNVEHIAEHGVSPEQAEFVVRNPRRGYPQRGADEKYLVRGQDRNGKYLQVIYVFSPPGITYVIHARPLTDREKRRLRRGNQS